MRRIFSFLFLAIAPAAVISAALASEPVNLSQTKQTLLQYHDSGAYEKDINATMLEALTYLKKRVAQPPKTGKLAIVLDIDETSLSNFASMRDMDFGGTFDQIREAEDKGDDTAIPATLDLYRYAKAHGVAVFFVTGRAEFERAVTEKNLRQAGFSDWNKLVLRSKTQEHLKAAVYKTAVRKQLAEQGYRIVLNIGDQQSDLAGGYSEKTFKLPNPYYFIP